MNILVTAGNTQVLIDRVRCVTNIFTGRTGAEIALHCRRRGHRVTLLTSRPEVVAELGASDFPEPDGLTVRAYRTFDDLHIQMEEVIRQGGLDAIVHCAAVSDYRAEGIYAPAADTRFHPEDGRWESTSAEPPRLLDKSQPKVKSDEPELWLRLVRTPKLVDFIRDPWGFRGVLVKFKLEVGLTDEQLLDVAERSRRHSDADLMVANTLEGSASWAYLGPLKGSYERVSRRELPPRLLEAVQALHEEQGHG